MLWIAGITNAMNFLDNMDGLLAGVSAVISAFFLVLSIINGQYLVGLLSAAVLGSCVGFLFWNLNPATVFMGDSGSMFLGFLLACIAIKLRFLGQSPVCFVAGAGDRDGCPDLRHDARGHLAVAARQESTHQPRQGPHIAPPGESGIQQA